MSIFKPCQGKSSCRYDHVHCQTCGREIREIERLRFSMDQLAKLAIDYEYENIDEYTAYIANKLIKSITYRQQEAQQENEDSQGHAEIN